MGRKGCKRHLKRIAAPKAAFVRRKAHVWMAKPSPGPGRASKSITLLSAVRDILRLVADAREANAVIKAGAILVDGKRVSEPKFPVSLMSVVSVPALQKNFRAVVDSKQRIKLVEVSAGEAGRKLCKVTGARLVPGGRMQVSLHDGRNLLVKGKPPAIGSSIVVSIPGGKASAQLPLEPGAKCIVTGGKHAGRVALLKEIIPGSVVRDAEARLSFDSEEFVTLKKYLFVVDDGFKA